MRLSRSYRGAIRSNISPDPGATSPRMTHLIDPFAFDLFFAFVQLHVTALNPFARERTQRCEIGSETCGSNDHRELTRVGYTHQFECGSHTCVNTCRSTYRGDGERHFQHSDQILTV